VTGVQGLGDRAGLERFEARGIARPPIRRPQQVAQYDSMVCGGAEGKRSFQLRLLIDNQAGTPTPN
jgi:hypothetical protein